MYSSEKEFKERRRLIKYLRGTHERFKKRTNFEANAKGYIDNLFAALHFDEDEQIITLVLESYRELKRLLTPLRGDNYEIYKFLVIVDSFFTAQYVKIVERFYR